ncbi:MAG: ABC transporter ATP-binding protein [Actinomycetota bacterium]|nr:ABC transporter ATP-binding protein [Actinomycetota bacterium]
MTGVAVKDVSAGYGAGTVLADLSLDVGSGEFLAVLGASGSGKTTLLKVIAGLLRPQSGTVRFGDRIVSSPDEWVPPERRRVGLVPQEGALFPHLTVAGNVAFGLPRGTGGDVDRLLGLVGMDGMGGLRPQELSGGQQQRVALARALAPSPEVICLDEPWSALDASLRVRLRGEVRELLAGLGTTAILVTHDQEEALSIADRVAVVRDGRIVQVDAPEVLYSRPADLGTASFVGEAILLDARAVRDGVVSTALGEIHLVAGSPQRPAGQVLLRPEQLAIVAEHAVGSGEPHGAPGSVAARSYHGHDSLVTVRLDAGPEIAVRAPGGAGAAPGERVSVVVGGPGVLIE